MENREKEREGGLEKQDTLGAAVSEMSPGEYAGMDPTNSCTREAVLAQCGVGESDK